jgi:hypothetical protein
VADVHLGGSGHSSRALPVDVREEALTGGGAEGVGEGQQAQSERQREDAYRIHSVDEHCRGDDPVLESADSNGGLIGGFTTKEEDRVVAGARAENQEPLGGLSDVKAVASVSGEEARATVEDPMGSAEISGRLGEHGESPREPAVEREGAQSGTQGLAEAAAQAQGTSGKHDEKSAPSSGKEEDRTRDSKHVTAAWETLVRWGRFWRNLHKGDETDALTRTTKICVFGGGSFGTAMAVLLARNKPTLDIVLLVRDPKLVASINNDHINTRYMPKHSLPSNIRATTDAAEAIQGSQYAIHAVPVQQSAAFLKGVASLIPASLPIVSVSKGLEVSTLETMAELIPRALGRKGHPVAVLSGPSFSVELMDKKPTGLVAASKDPELARACQQLLASQYLRINTTR